MKPNNPRRQSTLEHYKTFNKENVIKEMNEKLKK